MRITGLGHAGMFIETAGGSILCDPVSVRRSSAPGSRSPTTARWTGSGSARPTSCTFATATATISTRGCCESTSRRTSRCCCPTTRPTTSRQDLRALGYENIVYTHAGEIIERGDLKIMVTPLRAPSDGPIGDSS